MIAALVLTAVGVALLVRGYLPAAWLVLRFVFWVGVLVAGVEMTVAR